MSHMSSIFLLSDETDLSFVEQVELAYVECELIARRASSSFFRTFRHLPESKRKSVNALYAFCRRVDDIVDGDWLPDEDLSHLDLLTKKHCQELLEERTFNALYSKGMEDDLFETTYERFEDLRRYCYRVASTVGLCLIEIYGYSDPNARRHAVEMGIFLQLVNVLRDIQEDLSRNRIYIPSEELAKFDISHSDLHDSSLAGTKAWQNFMRHYIGHIHAHRKSALGLLPLLDKDARRSPRLMCMAYNAILDEAVRRNGDVLSRRLTLNFYRKMQVAFSTLLSPNIK